MKKRIVSFLLICLLLMQSAVIVFPAAAQVETRPLYNAPVEESFSSAIDFAALRSYLVEQLKSAPSRVNIADFEIENTAENETAPVFVQES